MVIKVAGEIKEVQEGITLTDLIVSESIENPEYVSISLNEDFVKLEKYKSTVLKENDTIEFLYYMGGGI